jgi:hypothetical protein
MLSVVNQHSEAAWNPTPSQFVGKRFNSFFFVAGLIPFSFILIKMSGRKIVSPRVGDSLASFLGVLWPVFPSQYAALSNFGSAYDAPNYALFFLCLVLLAAVFVLKFASDYISDRNFIKNTSWRDLTVVGISLCISYYVLFYDKPKMSPKPIFDFYVDAFGFYYLRQYLLFLTVYLAILVTVASLLKLKIVD